MRSGKSAWSIFFIALIVVTALALYLLFATAHDDRSAVGVLQGFRYAVIDARGPKEPWGKTVGDLNGDARIDLIVAGNGHGGLVWYPNPT